MEFMICIMYTIQHLERMSHQGVLGAGWKHNCDYMVQGYPQQSLLEYQIIPIKQAVNFALCTLYTQSRPFVNIFMWNWSSNGTATARWRFLGLLINCRKSDHVNWINCQWPPSLHIAIFSDIRSTLSKHIKMAGIPQTEVSSSSSSRMILPWGIYCIPKKHKIYTKTKKKKNLHGLSPQANYTDRVTATCRGN
jgi:hypothetical protein